jgi:NarL family two-component system response regulator LiaR
LPPLLILDIALGAENGLEVIPLLKEICEKREAPLPGIVVCSMYDDIFAIQSALDAGAGAFVSKSSDLTEISPPSTRYWPGEHTVPAVYDVAD